MFKPVEQQNDIRQRHPDDKNDNIYLEFEKYMSIDTIPLPVGLTLTHVWCLLSTSAEIMKLL
jgi:hypothetical protein